MSVTSCRPILFSAPMVRAILAGRKTQTRRVLQARPATAEEARGEGSAPRSPYGQRGDRLWVRETFCPSYFDDGRPGYRADYDRSKLADVVPEPKWTPSIYMPRALSRLTLAVTDVRVERLQAITEEDARAEGLDTPGVPHFDGDSFWHPGEGSPLTAFRSIWHTLNGKRAPWSSNPWVWVVSFRMATPSTVATQAQP